MHLDSFEILAILLAVTAIVGVLSIKFKQPLIIAFIIVGVIVGSLEFIFPQDDNLIKPLAEVGIAILLFVVGLKMNLDEIKNTGKTALIISAVKFFGVGIVGFLIAMAFGQSIISALYIAFALTFSSTIIIIKSLSDRRELESLYGRIAIAVLVIEDIIVIIAMIIITAIGSPSIGGGDSLTIEVVKMLLLGAAFIGAIILISKFILPRIIKGIAKSGEMLVLFAVAWAVALSVIGGLLGFGTEIGAFLAGVSLASTSIKDDISARLTPLRDFFLLFFFIDLGMQLDIQAAVAQFPLAIVLALVILLGIPVVVTILMGRLGYRSMTGFSVGLSIAQISEFSLILVALGVTYGHIPASVLGVITMVAIITITASVYLIRFESKIYRFLRKSLSKLQSKEYVREDYSNAETDMASIIVLGLGNYGSRIAKGLAASGISVTGVDFDPSISSIGKEENLTYHFGDLEDPSLVEHLPTDTAVWIISTVSSHEVNLEFLNNMKETEFPGQYAVLAGDQEEAVELKEAGVALVLMPYTDAADRIVELVSGYVTKPFTDGYDFNKVEF